MAEIDQATERLQSVQIRKRSLSGRSLEAREQQFAAKRAERFIGNIESALDLHRRLGTGSELGGEVVRLREVVQALEGVRKAFKVMERVVQGAKGRLQLIVLDHASPDVWGSVDGVVGLPEWRDGIKLVPMAWLTEA